jgi:hypothetical protein
MIVTEKLRWVPGGKGQVAGHDRGKTIMTGLDTALSQPKKFQVMGANTKYQCGTKNGLFKIITEEMRWVPGGKGKVAGHDRMKPTMTSPDTKF